MKTVTKTQQNIFKLIRYDEMTADQTTFPYSSLLTPQKLNINYILDWQL